VVHLIPRADPFFKLNLDHSFDHHIYISTKVFFSVKNFKTFVAEVLFVYYFWKQAIDQELSFQRKQRSLACS
jgi:hypothetical protein